MPSLERASARHVRAVAGDLRSEHTTRQYGLVEGAFVRWLSERLGRAATLLDLSPDSVRQYAAWLVESGRSRETARQYVSVLKRWAAFCDLEYGLGGSPLAAVKPGKRRRRAVETLTQDEVARMLDAVHRGRRNTALRDRAAILVLLDTGLRASELCDLRLEDVRLPTRTADGWLCVRHGKGDKERIVPLRAVAARALEVYLEDERPQDCGHAFAFCQPNGTPWSREALLRMVRELGKRAGIIGKRVSPHTLRATYTTIALVAGNQAARVQDALGHVDAGTMQHYVSAAELRKAPYTSPLEYWRTIR